jgi:hypothetical protein
MSAVSPSYQPRGQYDDSSPWNGVAINLGSDTNLNPVSRGIWVGTTGNIVVDFAGGTGTGVTYSNVPVGYLAGHFSKVYSTGNGTTASNLIAVW